jgi:hypothetical protein
VVVFIVLEDGAHPLMDLTGLCDRLLGIDLDPQEQLLDNSVPFQAVITVEARAVDRLLKDLIGLGQPPGLGQRGAEAR